MSRSVSRKPSVTVTVSPDRSRAAVELVGDLDQETRPLLNDAVHHLAAAAPERIEVDVAALTYVGSVLPNFLSQVRTAVPAACVLTVSRPSPWTHFVLRVTGMAEIACIDDPVLA